MQFGRSDVDNRHCAACDPEDPDAVTLHVLISGKWKCYTCARKEIARLIREEKAC